MSYGYVYVAQVAMGADYEQCMKAFIQAEHYDGPSLIIAYAPFQLDSKEPNESYRRFVMGEHRYSSLTITFPERAKELMAVAEKQAKNRYLSLKKRAKED